MPDQFSNARAYFDPTHPSSGDGFDISKYRNAFTGLAQLDALPLQPRAHNPANRSILIRGRDASNFYNPVYAGDADAHVNFVSGDTTNFATPSSNPRIDIVYMTPSGDYKIAQGGEAVSPTLPSLSPSGDSRFPICAVYNRPGQAKIVNFEDRNSNTGDGYIYQDLRPWFRGPGAGSATLGGAIPLNPTGDGQATAGVATTASRVDHRHGGVHAVRAVGQANLQGDVEIAASGDSLTQGGNRITIPLIGRILSIKTFTATGSSTWNRPSNCSRIRVRAVGGGSGEPNGTQGGGGGGYCERLIVAPNSAETVTVGAGGATSSNPGLASSFGSWLTAGGGQVDGTGGTATGGDINIPGQTGGGAGIGDGGDSHMGFGAISGIAAGGQKYGGGASSSGGAGGDGIVIVEEYS